MCIYVLVLLGNFVFIIFDVDFFLLVVGSGIILIMLICKLVFVEGGG